MLALIILTLLDPPGAWRFVDESAADGRAVNPYRTVELAATPSRPLHAADKPPAGSKFGSASVGPGGKLRLAVVWHAPSRALWFDADGDGRFAPAERVTLGDAPHSARVTVPFGGGQSAGRTLSIRPRGDGLAWSVRGYAVGGVDIAGQRVAARLTDGDADGCFDSAGADRVWLDLDGDGRFDPLAEQFPLGDAVRAAGTAVLLKPQADGLGLAARERPKEVGTLAVRVARLPLSKVVELTANCVSEFGELVVVRSEGPLELPAGKYRVDGVTLRLADAEGKVWSYGFYTGDRSGYQFEVTQGGRTEFKLLDDLAARVDFAAGAAPGDAVRVRPGVAAGALEMSKCEVGTKFTDYGRGQTASILLTEPGSVVLDRCESGFN